MMKDETRFGAAETYPPVPHGETYPPVRQARPIPLSPFPAGKGGSVTQVAAAPASVAEGRWGGA